MLCLPLRTLVPSFADLFLCLFRGALLRRYVQSGASGVIQQGQGEGEGAGRLLSGVLCSTIFSKYRNGAVGGSAEKGGIHVQQ